MFGETFGVTNGVITISALVVGMQSAGADKRAIVSAMVALLVSDPISDAYALYNAQVATEEMHARARRSTSGAGKLNFRESKSSAVHEEPVPSASDVARQAFVYQVLLQVLLLGVFSTAASSADGVARCLVVGMVVVVLYERAHNVRWDNTVHNLVAIVALVGVTHLVESRLAQGTPLHQAPSVALTSGPGVQSAEGATSSQR